jgi:arylsulfatase A-like enzyme
MRSIAAGLSVVVLVSVGIAGRLAASEPAAAATSSEDRSVPVVRLADVSARDEGWREPATVTIGNTSHYVLGRSDAVPVEVRKAKTKVEVDPKGRLALEISCPPETPGSHNIMIQLVGLRVADKMLVSRVTRRLGNVCRGEGGARRTVRLEGLHPGATVLLAVASMIDPPLPIVVSPLVDVPAGAELRVAMGVRAEGKSSAAPLDVRVTAIAPSGKRSPLASRTVRASDVAPPGTWLEWRLPLDDARRALGSRMRLVFEATSHTEESGLLHVLWGDPMIFGPPRGPASEEDRNLVLISIDTLRADRLGAMGYPLDVSPNLDRLARDGTIFTDVTSLANWTKPSHATMLTGTFPCVHGVDWGGPAIGGPLPAGIVPLAERLRRAGFVTGAFTEDAYVSPDVFQRGFDIFVADHGPSKQFGDVEHTVARAVRWITDNARRRFFMFVHTYQVHEPYTPPAAYASIAGTAPVPALPGLPPPAAKAMSDAAAYLGEIAYTDAVLERLFETIDKLGLRKSTIVVVTSDHGEAFGEHGVRYHGTGLQQEQVHVPLMVRAPGLVAAGRRIDDLVGLVDLTPTVLDLLGFGRPAWMQGLSLAPAMRVGSDQKAPPGRAFPLRGFGTIRGIRGETWKVRFGKKPRIWDLVTDPGELRPKVAAARTVEAMEKAAKSWCDRGLDLVAKAKDARRETRRLGVSIEEQLKLRALGYVQ